MPKSGLATKHNISVHNGVIDNGYRRLFLDHLNHFVKDAFNFGTANPARPNGIVYENALGDPTRGTRLYCLG